MPDVPTPDDDDTVTRPSAPWHAGAGTPAPDTGTSPGPESTRARPSVPDGIPHLPGVPGYAVLREVARGGMGAVYLAYDPTFDRDVAVKVMHRGQDGGRFVTESKITAQLPHPGIPPVHALGELPDGRPFLVMKLIDGRTLADEQKSASHADLLRLLGAFEAICQTVGFAHSKGIIHRDLKPANVMVGAFGEVLVMDWGLAKYVEVGETAPGPGARPAGVEATRIGSVKGTPAFMAPEQARGEPVDARADVFALGGLLAVLLTGQPPFSGASTTDVVRKAAAADLADCFTRLDACAVDAELVGVAKACLAGRSAERPATGAAVASAVAAYRAGVEQRLRTAERERAAAEAKAAEEMNTRREAEAREIEQRKRRRTQVWLAASVALLAAAVGGFAWWRADVRAEQSQDRAERARKDGDRAVEDARRAEREVARLAQNTAALREHVTRCEDALRASDAKTAAATLAEIDRRLPDGGDELAPRVSRLRADLSLLRRLDDFDQFRWTPELPEKLEVLKPGLLSSADRWFPPDRVVAERARAALVAAEINVWAPPVAVERVRDSLLRDRLVAVLDLHLVQTADAGTRAVLRTVDPDTFRGELRDAIAADDRDRVAALTARPVALSQPAGFVAALGRCRIVPPARRLSILWAANTAHPADLDLLLVLGAWGLDAGGANPAERVRWLQAAAALAPNNIAANLLLGLGLTEMREYDGAATALQRAVRLAPGHPPTRQSLMLALQARGNARWEADDLYDAADAFREALSVDATGFPPNNPIRSTRLALGFVLGRTGDPTGAVVEYRAAVAASPDYAFARNHLAYELAAGPDDVRDGKGAIEHATRACELTLWRTPGHIATLAAAHAEAGDFGKAVEYQEKALTFPAYERQSGDEGRRRLALYLAKKPHRRPLVTPVAPPPRPAGR